MKWSPFQYREIITTGLRERCGSLAVTAGAFHVTTFIDDQLRYEHPETQRFVLAHETTHLLHHHGLWMLLLFPLRPVLLPIFEALADRYAVKIVGRAAAARAIKRLAQIETRTWKQSWIYGPTAKARAGRAGVGI